MIYIYEKDYPDPNVTDGKLVLGWPSWDQESHDEMSVKFVYKNQKGHVSRGCPELPIGIAVDLLLFAIEHNQLRTRMIDENDIFNDPRSGQLKETLKNLAQDR